MNMKLTSPTLKDWCKMWSIMEHLGYDTSKDIHTQFCNIHSLPLKKKPPKNIRRYEPHECRGLDGKNQLEGSL